jgi:hypothetical protein
MENYLVTLRDELQNRCINFVDDYGYTQYVFDFTTKKLYGNLTNWKEINIRENKKYKSITNIKDDYYYGNYNNENYKKMMAISYRVTIKKTIFSKKYKYIFMIIDNPFYNINSNSQNSTYKLIIFNLNQQGIYTKYLAENSIFSSI